jgi:hypothetical protein
MAYPNHAMVLPPTLPYIPFGSTVPRTPPGTLRPITAAFPAPSSYTTAATLPVVTSPPRTRAALPVKPATAVTLSPVSAWVESMLAAPSVLDAPVPAVDSGDGHRSVPTGPLGGEGSEALSTTALDSQPPPPDETLRVRHAPPAAADATPLRQSTPPSDEGSDRGAAPAPDSPMAVSHPPPVGVGSIDRTPELTPRRLAIFRNNMHNLPLVAQDVAALLAVKQHQEVERPLQDTAADTRRQKEPAVPHTQGVDAAVVAAPPAPPHEPPRPQPIPVVENSGTGTDGGAGNVSARGAPEAPELLFKLDLEVGHGRSYQFNVRRQTILIVCIASFLCVWCECVVFVYFFAMTMGVSFFIRSLCMASVISHVDSMLALYYVSHVFTCCLQRMCWPGPNFFSLFFFFIFSKHFPVFPWFRLCGYG